MGQPMGEGDVLIGHDVHVVEVECVLALAHFHAFQPMRAIGRLAAKLQGLDGVVGDDVVGVQGHDFIDVLRDDRLTVIGDQGLDFIGLTHGGSPWFLLEDTLSRPAIRQIDSRNKNNPRAQTR
ncbi:hypothetical protein D9M71_766360 [compost metagenome]